MARKIVASLAVATAIFVLPLVGAPGRLVHPGPWLGFLTGFLILVTQPALGPKKMVTDIKDRFSALGIFAGVIGGQLAAVIDFGYRPDLRPEAVSWITLAGIVVALCGLGLRLWSIRILGKFFTATVEVQDGQTVVNTGPYRLVRHPSYTGTLFTGLGVCLAMWSGIGAALTLLLALPAYLYRVHVEERELVVGLGEPYVAYRKRTWRLVPFVY